MTNRTDVAKGREIVARWCALAEARLEHLTELFESGRWRRYHSEPAFLENIREAKAAVEIWRGLLSREASLDNSLIDMSWLGRPRWTLPPNDGWRERIPSLQPQPKAVPVEPPRANPAETDDVLVALQSILGSSVEAPAAPDAPAVDEMPLRALDLSAMQERYPLLRNAL
jgi:uncharacterized repeat protein (TIGR03809 family)